MGPGCVALGDSTFRIGAVSPSLTVTSYAVPSSLLGSETRSLRDSARVGPSPLSILALQGRPEKQYFCLGGSGECRQKLLMEDYLNLGK